MTGITANNDEAGWLPGVRRVPSPNFNCRPQGAQVSLLVIHNISLPPGQFGGEHICNFFTNRLDCQVHPFFAEIAGLQVSAHFLIDRAGEITQFVPVHERAWHAGESCFQEQDNCNDFSLGIELEGADDVPYTDSQYESLARLTGQLIRMYPAITPERIVGHSDIAPGRKTDPGPAFDWPRYKAQLASDAIS